MRVDSTAKEGAATRSSTSGKPGEAARQRSAERPGRCNAHECDDEEERARCLHRAARKHRREPQEEVEARRLRREDVLAELPATSQGVGACEVDALVVVRPRVERA